MIQDMMGQISDINIESFKGLITPREIQQQIPLSDESLRTVLEARQVIERIIDGQDPRKFVVIGPCSIHDPVAALEYARRLKALASKVSDRLFLVMRAYFEKPRTTVGWKGYVNDPFLDNSFNMNEGLIRSRQLLCDITHIGVPMATEALEPISPQYLSQLISWTAIGARTTESQSHREMASGVSSPVGFKNNTDGNVHVAVNAIKSAALPHNFLGIDQDGKTAIVSTRGNSHCHLILRGGGGRPNYDSVSVKHAEISLAKAGLKHRIMIDCSHDNSGKDFTMQPVVLHDCVGQIVNGNQSIIGFMIESHLHEGTQKLSENLKYGVSITDGCVGWETTEEMILRAYKRLGINS